MGRKKLDLTGQRFGRLVVVRDSGEKRNGAVMWDCLCDCGNTTLVRSDYLREKRTKSCGCLRRENGKRIIYRTPSHRKKIDITDNVYGRLKVISRSDKTLNGHQYWRCECECGAIKDISGQNLKSGRILSCGCYFSEMKKTMKKAHDWSAKNDLKESTRLSLLNDTIYSDNTSGYKGVSWKKQEKKWVARIGFQGKAIHLGYFVNKQDAINARLEAEEKYFKPILEKYGVEK